MKSGAIFFRSDTLLRLRGPTDEALGTAITGATVTGRLYDTSEDTAVASLTTHVRGDEAALQTIISIPKIRPLPWSSGDTIQVVLDDGSLFQTTISGAPDTSPVDEDRITLALGISSAASAGNEIRLVTKVAGVGTIPVERGAELFAKNDVLELRNNDGTRQVNTIQQIHTPTVQEGTPLADAIDHPKLPTLIQFQSVTTGALSPRALVLRKLGADIAMAQYGTPLPDDDLWGYSGTIQQTHADLELGMKVRAEIEFSGGGIDHLFTLNLPVVWG